MMVEKKDLWVKWSKKVNVFKLDASMSSITLFHSPSNNLYKMVYFDAREDVLCGYYRRNLA